MAAARGLDVTLDRAVDLMPYAGWAMVEVRALGIRRVLSSGPSPTAAEGLARRSARRGAWCEAMPGLGFAPRECG